MADFRYQQGLYFLHDNYGPSYVGLTRNQGLGSPKRNKNYMNFKNAEKWEQIDHYEIEKYEGKLSV